MSISLQRNLESDTLSEEREEQLNSTSLEKETMESTTSLSSEYEQSYSIGSNTQDTTIHSTLDSSVTSNDSASQTSKQNSEKTKYYLISPIDYPFFNEATLFLDNQVLLQYNGQWVDGIFTLYQYGIQFQAYLVMMSERKQDSPEDLLLNFYIPFTMIHTIHKSQRSTNSNGPSSTHPTSDDNNSAQLASSNNLITDLIQNASEVVIITKHLRKLTFLFSIQKETADKVMKHIISNRARVRSFDFYKAELDEKWLRSKTENLPHPSLVDGWKLFDPYKEFERQGALQSKNWRISSLNTGFKYIATYPEMFCVPTNLEDVTIIKGLKKRSKNRVPVLSWFSKEKGVSMSRCAQPNRGLNLKRKKFSKDIAMINAFIETNPIKKRMTIIDLRPKLNAQANRIKGAGFEDISKYENCELKFMNIANIHAMRESFHNLMKQILENPSPKGDKWATSMESTKWIQYLHLILKAATFVVEVLLGKGETALVHCSDGWDRASQIVCVTQILLDPYFRTLEGFCILIQKDFINFGHMFDKRIGHSAYNPKDSEQSPIFFQFIEVVFNLMCQFPTAFEFNEFFLVRILDEAFACRYGTFLCNSEKERYESKLSNYTKSLWTDLLDSRFSDLYRNKAYNDVSGEVLKPDTRECSIKLWSNYWLRFTKENIDNMECFDIDGKVNIMQLTSLLTD